MTFTNKNSNDLNLASLDWWNELWLNEGFATFVGWLAVDNLYPEWKVWSLFLLDDYARGKELDSLRSSHPIDVPVKSPAEITQIFDAISYCKGASVIRMLNSFLGKDGFKNGLYGQNWLLDVEFDLIF